MDQFWDQWNKIPIAAKFLGVIVIWGLLAAGYYFSFYDDQIRMYNVQLRKFNTVREQRMKNELIAMRLPRWEKEIARLRGELAKARTLLPTKKEIPNLLRKIDDLGNRSGLKLVQFRPLAEVPREFYSDVPMEMEVSGTFYEVMVFFDKISNLDRIVNVAQIQLENPTLKNQKLLLVARFRLITYRFIAPTGAPKKG